MMPRRRKVRRSKRKRGGGEADADDSEIVPPLASKTDKGGEAMFRPVPCHPAFHVFARLKRGYGGMLA